MEINLPTCMLIISGLKNMDLYGAALRGFV